MITKKRCPFRRQDCTDKCALYELETKRCAIACIATQAQRIAGELYYIADAIAPQAKQQEEDKT